MTQYDVIVIGGGAAGLSAALVLSRAQRRVLVVDAGKPRNARAAHMHGFVSRDGMPPGELLAVGRAEVQAYGGEIRTASVTKMARGPVTGFEAALDGGDIVSARAVVAATGLRDVLPDVPGVEARFGRDVLHCPYCHGYEVRDQPVAVLGGSPNSIHQAQLVRQWCPDVVFFAHTSALGPEDSEAFEARAIGVVDGPVTELVIDNDRLYGVRLSDGSVVRRTALFVAPRFEANDTVFADLGCAVDADGRLISDATGRTNVPGLWVAGNVSNVRAQVITAAGEGSSAAIALNAELVNDDVARALRSFRSKH
jgi:thioredoxin reductase